MEAFQPTFDIETLVKCEERINYANLSSHLYTYATI